MTEPINPYIAGAPVTDPSMFFGREDVFAWIAQNIAGQYSDNTLVVHGQRRVGKTSVLKQLHRRLPDRYIPIFFDFQGRTHTTLDQFLWRLAREIVRTLGKQGVQLPKPERDPFTQDSEHFSGPFLDAVRRSLGDRNLVLVFDEFDSLEDPTAKEMLAVDLIPFFSRMMHGAEGINFIFSIGSSGHRLEYMRAEYTDFFRLALYKKISFLEPDQGRRLIVEPVRDVMEYHPDAVDRILGLTSGHPYFTQLTCHELFAKGQRTGDWHIGLDDVEQVLPDVIERGTVNLKFVWDDATDAERYTMTALAAMSKPGSKEDILATLRQHKVRLSEEEIGTALLNLVARDVLAKEHQFTVDLLRYWLLQNRPVERVVDELAEKHPIAIRFTQIAEEYREQGLYNQALENYQQALEAASDYLTARLGVAEIHHERQDWAEAVTAYRAVLALDDQHIQAQTGLCDVILALGDAAQTQGDTGEAIDHYLQVLEIYGEHTEARQRLTALHLAKAEMLGQQKKWTAANESVTQAWDYLPQEMVPAQGTTDFDEAIAALRQALETLQAQLAQEQLARAIKLREGKQFSLALAALLRAQAYAPDSPEIARTVKETQEAEQAAGLERMLEAGERAVRAGRWQDATGIFERILALEPEDTDTVTNIQEKLAHARAQQRLAQSYATAVRTLEEKNYRQAATLLQDILAQEPGYRNAQQLLDEAHRARRRRRFGILAALACGAILLGALGWALSRPESPLMVALGPPTPTTTATPTPTVPPTGTPLPTPTSTPRPLGTPVPLAWRRIYGGGIFPRAQVSALAIDPVDSAVLYAGTQGAGIYRSLDGGISWQPAHAGLGSALVFELLIRPDQSQTLFAGSIPTRIYRSDDRAATWQGVTNQRSANMGLLTLDPNDTNRLYYTDGKTLLVSITETQWQKLSDLPCEEHTIVALAHHPTESGVFFIGTWQYELENDPCEQGLFWTQDDGENWERLPLPPEADPSRGTSWRLATSPADPGFLYAAQEGIPGIYRSVDNGQNWQRVNAEFACNNHHGLYVSEQGNVYCLLGDNFAFSTDQGTTWRELPPTGLERPTTLVTDPQDEQQIYLGGLGIHRSTNGGQSWEEISNGLGNGSLELWVDPLDGSHLYAAYSAGAQCHFYHSEDNGRSWKYNGITGTGCGLSFEPTSGALLMASKCRDDSPACYLRSTDHGQTWQETALDIPESRLGDFPFLLINPQDPLRWYWVNAGCDPGYPCLYTSLDGGTTWQVGRDLTKGDNSRLLSSADGEKLFLITSEYQARSQDGGLTWIIMDCNCFDQAIERRAIAALNPLNPDILYIGRSGGRTDDGGVFRSENGGDTFRPINYGLTNLSVNALAIHPTNPDIVYAGTDGGAFVSFNGGAEWGIINDGLLGATVIYAIAIDPNDPSNVYAATPYGIFMLE